MTATNLNYKSGSNLDAAFKRKLAVQLRAASLAVAQCRVSAVVFYNTNDYKLKETGYNSLTFVVKVTYIST